MSKRFLLTIIVILLSLVLTVHSDSDEAALSRLESGLLKVDNPFKSQLPEIEEPKIDMPDKPPTTKDTEDKSPSMPALPKPKIEPPEIKERPVPNVTINGIIWNSDRPQAIINGKIIDIGDTISEIKITEIRKTGIDGLFDGRHVTLKP